MIAFKVMIVAGVAAFSLLATLTPASAAPIEINFDSFTAGTSMASPLVFPEATFTSSTGFFHFTDVNPGEAPAAGRVICATDSSPEDCPGELIVDFASPVSNLSFLFSNDDGVNVVGDARAFAAVSNYRRFFSSEAAPMRTPQHLSISAPFPA